MYYKHIGKWYKGFWLRSCETFYDLNALETGHFTSLAFVRCYLTWQHLTWSCLTWFTRKLSSSSAASSITTASHADVQDFFILIDRLLGQSTDHTEEKVQLWEVTQDVWETWLSWSTRGVSPGIWKRSSQQASIVSISVLAGNMPKECRASLTNDVWRAFTDSFVGTEVIASHF